MTEVSLKELLESGAHFGHRTRRWNPKMNKFIYGVRGGVHIIDLTHTADYLQRAVDFAREAAVQGDVLFVGTKRQAAAIVKAEAEACGMPYVTERWLGGMLTNYRTIRNQINRLKKLEAEIASGETAQKYNKKEAARIQDEVNKLNRVLSGVKDMDQMPAAVYVVDAPYENIAVAEAIKLGIPVIGIADSNADPDQLDYPIPANDDAIKSIKVITHAIADAVAKGKSERKTEEAPEAQDAN